MLPCLIASLLAGGQVVPASTWATTGLDCESFTLVDVDGDGFDDVVTRRGDELLVARTVRGWKAAAWTTLDDATWRAAADRPSLASSSSLRHAAPPPYEPDAKVLSWHNGDIDGDGDHDTLAVFRCTRPHDYLELRVAFTPGPDANDRDGDGLSEADETKLASDPLDRDSDHDGLLDGWEVHGLPRGIALGEGISLSPVRQDVIVAVTPYEPLDRAQIEAELARAALVYKELATTNLDGSRGIALHVRMDASLPVSEQTNSDWAHVGNLRLAPRERGLLHWMQITPGGGGQAQQTGDMGGCGVGAAVFAHEFGHQLSLGHEGDSIPTWCPLYRSLMNYAFNYALPTRFSSGEFRATTLDESALEERLPYPFDALSYLAGGPYHFTLAKDGDSATRIDWNHDGRFDDAPVSADVNYGGSTNCGVRRDLGIQIGAAPALGYVAGKLFLATVDPRENETALREYLGDERWGEPRVLPNSASAGDPLIVGGDEFGLVLLERGSGWGAWRFSASEVFEQAEIAGIPGVEQRLELSAARVGTRILFIARASDGALTPYWLDGLERLEVAPAAALALRSQAPVGIGVDPRDGRVVVASTATSSRGLSQRLRVSWFRVEGDELTHDETRWVGGEDRARACSTRPAIAFDAAGQLNVFHTDTLQADGSMTMQRTRRIGNAALDDGWLTCLLYDIWTRTRRPIGFANGPQGAVFAFRWDAAEAHGMRLNQLLVAHNGFGIDREPMRDFDDGAKMSKHGLVHSILYMRPEGE